MIKRFRTFLKRKLNKSGFALIEVFFSFVVLIVIAVGLINFYSVKEDSDDMYRSVSVDNYNSIVAVNKALLYTSPLTEYSLHLKNYIPVINRTAPNEIHIFNNIADGKIVETPGVAYELTTSIKVSNIITNIKKNEKDKEFQQFVSYDLHKGVKIKYIPVSNVNDKNVKSPNLSEGVYRLFEDEVIQKRSSKIQYAGEVDFSDEYEVIKFETEY